MRLPARPALLAAAVIALGLGGCDKKPAERTQAAGEILPGTVSDAMIATDQTRAEPPIAPRAIEAGEPGKAKPKAAASAADEAEPEPAASATPEVSPPAPASSASPPAN